MKWIKIFSSQDIDKEKLSPTLHKRSIPFHLICIVQIGPKMYAVQNRCPHQGASLSTGKINSFHEIICPLHNYRFHLITGREASQRCPDLTTYPIKETPEGFFVGIR